jgi:hypothetical protein
MISWITLQQAGKHSDYLNYRHIDQEQFTTRINIPKNRLWPSAMIICYEIREILNIKPRD